MGERCHSCIGVLTPTFVTFQTQHSASPKLAFWLGLIAISITASTGIVTGLQATFRWGEGFGRASTASLELDELAAATDLDTLVTRTSPDYTLKHTELTKHRDRALRQMQSIIRKYIEGELTVVKEGERPQQEISREASERA